MENIKKDRSMGGRAAGDCDSLGGYLTGFREINTSWLSMYLIRLIRTERRISLSESYQTEDELQKQGIRIKFNEPIPQQHTTLCRIAAYLISEMGRNRETALSGQLIEIPISGMVKAGIFANKKKASQYLRNTISILAGVSVFLQSESGYTEKETPLFDEIERRNGSVWLSLNLCDGPEFDGYRRIKWAEYLGQYAPVPDYIYSLSDTAFSLMFYTVYRMRQSGKQIKEEKPVSMSLKKIIRFLALPEHDRRKAHYVFNPIKKAIAEIGFRESQMIKAKEIEFEYPSEKMRGRKNLADIQIQVRVYGAWNDELKAAFSTMKKKKRKPKKEKKENLLLS